MNDYFCRRWFCWLTRLLKPLNFGIGEWLLLYAYHSLRPQMRVGRPSEAAEITNFPSCRGPPSIIVGMFLCILAWLIFGEALVKSVCHRTHRNNRYTTINLTCVEDPSLSALAKAIHLYAMSRPEGWDLTTKDIFKRFKEGRDAVYKAIVELETSRYLRRLQPRREGNRFSVVEMHWYEEPLPLPDIHETEIPLPDFPYTESSDTESPFTEIQDAIVIDHGTKDQLSRDQVTSSAAAEGCAWCANPKQASSGVQFLTQRWHDLYRATFGRCPTIVPGRDAKSLTILLRASRTDEQIVGAMQVYLADRDQFYVRSGHSLGLFVNRFDGFLARIGRKENRLGSSNEDPNDKLI
jgi:hypothetical protein